MNLFIRRIRGIYSAILYPVNSGCLRCYRRWPIAAPHITDYGNRDPTGYYPWGCFPLCEDCWRELPIYKRVYYYVRLYDSWTKHREPIDTLEEILQAVLKGG